MELPLELVDGKRRARTAVDHGVTVGAYRAQVVDGVHLVSGHPGQLQCVVDVDEVLAERPVAFFEGEVSESELLPARPSHLRVSAIEAEPPAARGCPSPRSRCAPGVARLAACGFASSARNWRLGGDLRSWVLTAVPMVGNEAAAAAC
jgi:hypothetical protein